MFSMFHVVYKHNGARVEGMLVCLDGSTEKNYYQFCIKERNG